MIKTIAQIVPLIEFKFTLGKVASNVANSFEVLMINDDDSVCVCVCVGKAGCCSQQTRFQHVFQRGRSWGGGQSHKLQHVSLSSDWLSDDGCLIWAGSLPSALASSQVITVVMAP